MYRQTPRRYSTSARSTSEKSSRSTSERESASSSSAVFTSPLCARAIASPFRARTWSSGEPVPSTAGKRPRVLGDRVVEDVLAEQRVGPGEDRLGLGAVVGGDAAREEAGVDAEAQGEPVDRLAGRARLAALDLRDVLLREAVAGQLGLRQARRRPAAGARARRCAARARGCAPGCERQRRVLPRAARDVIECEVSRMLDSNAIPRLGHVPQKGHTAYENPVKYSGIENHLTELLDTACSRPRRVSAPCTEADARSQCMGSAPEATSSEQSASRRAELGIADPAPRLTRESPGCRSRGFLTSLGGKPRVSLPRPSLPGSRDAAALRLPPG